ncbi:MAG: response regulator [Alphaproteobacteria bacterium]|nr:response regulator [Alphaproteobacteria bacterium]
MSQLYDNRAYRQELLPFSVPYMTDDDGMLNILLVEDDYSDTLLTIQRINATQIPYNLDRITHGDDVMPYLGNCMQTRMPDLLLLDMGLPGTNGLAILEYLAHAPGPMQTIPIAIISGVRPSDKLKTDYRGLPIYGCLAKPLDIGEINPILSRVSNFRA